MIGKRIKELREKNNMTQKDLSKIIGVTDRSIGYYESGQRVPPPDILDKLAEFFSVSVDYIMGRTDNSNFKDSSIGAAKTGKRSDAKELQSLEEYIEQAKSLMFYGEIVDENDKKAILSALKAAYEVVVRKNKEKEKEGK